MRSITKPLAWLGHRKWYMLGAVALVVVGVLAAMFANALNKGAMADEAHSEERTSTGDATILGESVEQSDEKDEDDKPEAAATTTESAPTPPQTQPAAPPAPVEGPTENLTCTNNPPATFGLSPAGVFTAAPGEWVGAIVMSTTDASKVLWTASGTPNGEVSITLDSGPPGAAAAIVFGLQVSATAAPGTYVVSWTVEDGTRQICQRSEITVTVTGS